MNRKINWTKMFISKFELFDDFWKPSRKAMDLISEGFVVPSGTTNPSEMGFIAPRERFQKSSNSSTFEWFNFFHFIFSVHFIFPPRDMLIGKNNLWRKSLLLSKKIWIFLKFWKHSGGATNPISEEFVIPMGTTNSPAIGFVAPREGFQNFEKSSNFFDKSRDFSNNFFSNQGISSEKKFNFLNSKKEN